MTNSVDPQKATVPFTTMANPFPTPFVRRFTIETFDDDLSTGARSIHVYLPEGYDQSTERYQVMYYNDGGNVFSRPGSTQNVDIAYDGLMSDGLIEPTIFVGIATTSVKLRNVAYFGDGLHGYYRFISERLKPYIDSHFRTKPEASSTGIAGYSSGGSAAFLLAYNHPETFGMAGCMSPSLGSDNELAFRTMAEGLNGRKLVRFWLDAGGGEYEMWLDASRAYSMLERLGWEPGEDLAAYFDYSAEHCFEASALRMREMLYFLLRKAPLRLSDYRLVNAIDPSAGSLDLSTGHRRIVGAEAWYDNGLRLTVPRPNISVEDTAIVTVDSEDPFVLHCAGAGDTSISSVYQGLKASLRVVGCGQEDSVTYFPCDPVSSAPDIETNWPDSSRLPYEILDDLGMVRARFGVLHDATHLHIVAHVIKDPIITDAEKMPWENDTVEIYIDARSAHIRRKNNGYVPDDKFNMMIGVGPGDPGPILFTTSMPLGNDRHSLPGSNGWNNIIPEQTRITCRPTPGGYNALFSVPVSYLDEASGSPWETFRLNVIVNLTNPSGVPDEELLWQPRWSEFRTLINSGCFVKK